MRSFRLHCRGNIDVSNVQSNTQDLEVVMEQPLRAVVMDESRDAEVCFLHIDAKFEVNI